MKKKKGRLSEEDKGIIKGMKNKGADITEIAKSVRRTEKTVLNYLQNFNKDMAPIKKKNKTQYFHRKGATVMTETEAMRSDDAKNRPRSKDKPNRPVTIHKISE